MNFLQNLTFVVNFMALLLAIWLGLYVATRNPKYIISWLTALLLWSMAGSFLYTLFSIYPPQFPALKLTWLQKIPFFWPEGAPEQYEISWLLGWFIIPAITLWHHVTVLMRPGRMNTFRILRIVAVYLVGILALQVQTFNQLLYVTDSGNPLYLNSLQPGPWYPVFGIALVLISIASLSNLVHSAIDTPAIMPHKQLAILVSVSVFAGLTGPLSFCGSYFHLPIPMVAMSLLEGIPVGLIGYGVARYSALMEGRTINRDFLYNLITLCIIVGVYVLAAWGLIIFYGVSTVVLIILPVLAVITHSIINNANYLIDEVLFRKETSNLYAKLHKLARMAVNKAGLEENLPQALDSLCSSVRATYGFILLFDGDSIIQSATYRWRGVQISLTAKDFKADDLIHLAPGKYQAPLDEAALLIPLYGEEEQIGVILLGRPYNGIRYADEDLERLQYPADLISDIIFDAKQKTVLMAKLSMFTQAVGVNETHEKKILIEDVENALRNLYDFIYLADTALAETRLIESNTPNKNATHLDKGKVVNKVICDAINQLRPGTSIPRDPPPREWYPYLILKNAYLDGLPNRDIMMRLYISEGTFNRTRRNAVRALARTLVEMETSLQ